MAKIGTRPVSQVKYVEQPIDLPQSCALVALGLAFDKTPHQMIDELEIGAYPSKGIKGVTKASSIVKYLKEHDWKVFSPSRSELASRRKPMFRAEYLPLGPVIVVTPAHCIYVHDRVVYDTWESDLAKDKKVGRSRSNILWYSTPSECTEDLDSFWDRVEMARWAKYNKLWEPGMYHHVPTGHGFEIMERIWRRGTV